MKIFFFSTVFAPSVGGIQRVAEVLCTEFVRLGHEVQLATLTPAAESGSFPFPVLRRPTLPAFWHALRWSDVHVQANVSLKYAFPLLAQPGRVIYRHGDIYRQPDGSLAVLDRLKRIVARRVEGIANSTFSASELRCRHTIFNPYDHHTFRTTVDRCDREFDIVFLGRLVSVKGCDILLQALELLQTRGLRPTLTIIGDGPERPTLEAMSEKAELTRQIRFVGRMTGEALAAELNRHRIIVAPSRYAEPFGVVALEGLACGCLPIVSSRGGLSDAIGPHGLTFTNGDNAALAGHLERVLAEPDLATVLLAGVDSHLVQFHADQVAARYLDIFRDRLNAR